MTGRMPEYMSDEMSENMSDRMPDRLPDRMPGGMSGYMPDRMPEYMPEYMSDRMPENMADRMAYKMSEKYVKCVIYYLQHCQFLLCGWQRHFHFCMPGAVCRRLRQATSCSKLLQITCSDLMLD